MAEQQVTERHTHQMVVIHRIFRRGFAGLAEVSRELPADDPVRVRAVGEYAGFLLDGLHHHHAAEDAMLWPALEERAPADAELTARMAAQHSAVAAHIAAARAVLDDWDHEPDGLALARAVDALVEALAPHLDEEEARILPLVRAHVPLEVWERTGDRAFDGFTNEEKLIALGQLLEVSTPAEAEVFLAGLPVPVRLLWRVSGRRRYARFMGRVTGRAS